MSAEEIGSDLTDEIVCPYCGHTERDSWECSQNTVGCFDHQCDECGQTMAVEREISVTYSTWTRNTK